MACEIPLGAESVHLLAVALGIRGGYDQDKRLLAARTGPQLAQNVTCFIPRHVDVKEDEIRTGRRRVGVMLLSPFLSSPGHTASQRLIFGEYVADDRAELYEFIEARWFSEIEERGVFQRPIVIGRRIG
jgi:hypothetical protein